MRTRHAALRLAGVAMLAGMGLAAGPALAQSDAQIITLKDPKALIPVFEGLGYKPEWKSGDEPYISMTINGYNVSLAFYGCDDGTKNCRSMEYYAGFTTKTMPSAAEMNAFNAQWRFTKVYFDKDNDPALTWDVSVNEGITLGALRGGVRLFENSLTEFGDLVFKEPAKKK